jgi:hypothetical protein
VARPLNAIRGAIVGVMLAGFVLVIHLPWFSKLFALNWAPNTEGLVAVGVGVVGCALVSIAFALSGHRPADVPPGDPAPTVAG